MSGQYSQLRNDLAFNQESAHSEILSGAILSREFITIFVATYARSTHQDSSIASKETSLLNPDLIRPEIFQNLLLQFTQEPDPRRRFAQAQGVFYHLGQASPDLCELLFRQISKQDPEFALQLNLAFSILISQARGIETIASQSADITKRTHPLSKITCQCTAGMFLGITSLPWAIVKTIPILGCVLDLTCCGPCCRKKPLIPHSAPSSIPSLN